MDGALNSLMSVLIIASELYQSTTDPSIHIYADSQPNCTRAPQTLPFMSMLIASQTVLEHRWLISAELYYIEQVQHTTLCTDTTQVDDHIWVLTFQTIFSLMVIIQSVCLLSSQRVVCKTSGLMYARHERAFEPTLHHPYQFSRLGTSVQCTVGGYAFY